MSLENEEIINIARFLHEEYESASLIYGWKTQEKTRVTFENLPPENAKTMLHVARWLYRQKQEALHAQAEETKAFLKNILDGIDKADEEMQNKGGGTKAIRLALISRGLL